MMHGSTNIKQNNLLLNHLTVIKKMYYNKIRLWFLLNVTVLYVLLSMAYKILIS